MHIALAVALVWWQLLLLSPKSISVEVVGVLGRDLEQASHQHPGSKTVETVCTDPLAHAIPDKGPTFEYNLVAVTTNMPNEKEPKIDVGPILFRQSKCQPACPWIKSYNTQLSKPGLAVLIFDSVFPGQSYEACVENTQAAFAITMSVKYRTRV